MSSKFDLIKPAAKLNFKIKSNIPSFKATTFTNATVDAVTTSRDLYRYGANARLIYNSCKPYLGTGYNVPLESWRFAIIRTGTSEVPVAIPFEVIDVDSIEETSIVNIQVIIADVDSGEAVNIRDILSAHGYENITVTTY